MRSPSKGPLYVPAPPSLGDGCSIRLFTSLQNCLSDVQIASVRLHDRSNRKRHNQGAGGGSIVFIASLKGITFSLII